MIYQANAIFALNGTVQEKMEAVKRQNGKKVLLTYAGSHVFQLFSRIHLSNKWSDVGRQVQAGVSAFLHLIWCIFCSHLIELPNLFFKQQCSTKSHDIKQLNMSLKVCILCSSSFHCSTEWILGACRILTWWKTLPWRGREGNERRRGKRGRVQRAIACRWKARQGSCFSSASNFHLLVACPVASLEKTMELY